MIVADASMVVSALTDRSPVGRWASGALRSSEVLAPHHMPAEAANIIRRTLAWGNLSPAAADAALDGLLSLPLSLQPFTEHAGRVWALRDNVTVYDAWYVAVAEAFDCPLATLDGRLARAAGPRCRFLLPDGRTT